MKDEVIEKMTVMVTSAFGLVAALAWNSAIQEWFKSQTWLQAGGPFGYAFVVTIIAVLVAIWLGRVAEKAKNAVKINVNLKRK